MDLQSQIKDILHKSLDADYGILLQAKRLAWLEATSWSFGAMASCETSGHSWQRQGILNIHQSPEFPALKTGNSLSH